MTRAWRNWAVDAALVAFVGGTFYTFVRVLSDLGAA